MSVLPLHRSDRPSSRRRRGAILALLAATSGLAGALAISPAGAAVAVVPLGTAAQFGVLAGAGITNTGSTTINGDVGSFPTIAQTGFGSVTLLGDNHHGDAVTQQAKTDLITGYGVAAGSGPPTVVAVELGGTTLTPGVYASPTFGITGTLTLNTLGDPNAVFIFQAASTLTTAATSSVIVLGGGTVCNVVWQIGSSATLGTNSHLIGSVLADTSITATTGATINGRLLAMDGAVTLDANIITKPICAAAVVPIDPGFVFVPPTTAPPTTTTAAPTTTTTAAPTTTTTAAPTTTTTAAPTTTTTTAPAATAVTAPTAGTPVAGPAPAPPISARSSGSARVTSIGTTGTGTATGTGNGTGTGTGTATGTSRGGLPATGSNLVLPLLGLAALASGLVISAAARERRPSR